MTDKSQIRAEARARRAAFVEALDPAERSRCHGVLPSPLGRRIAPGSCVAGYVPIGTEADPLPLLAAARTAGASTALAFAAAPVQPLRFLEWQPGDPLVRGVHGLMQPDATRADLVPDIILVPLVAFDRALNRLGQGAGYYDRALALRPEALAVGIAWSVQEVAAIPVDVWDVPLDAVLTEKEWIVP